MTTRKNMFMALYVCLLGICLSGCDKKYSEDALLVKEAFECLNAGDADKLLSLAGDAQNTLGLGTEKKLTGCVWATEMVIEVDTAYPDRVFYACVIPGASAVTIGNVLKKPMRKKFAQEFSRNLKLKGEIPIRTDPQTGKRYMDISHTSDPFSLYLRIVYNRTTTVDSKNLMGTGKRFTEAVMQVAATVDNAYAQISGNEDHFSSVLLQPLTTLYKDDGEKLRKLLEVTVRRQEQAEEITIIDNSPPQTGKAKTENHAGAQVSNGISPYWWWMAAIAVSLLIGIILFVRSCIWAGWKSSFAKRLLLIVSDSDIRLKAVIEMTDTAVLKEVASKDSDSYVRLAALQKITDEEVLKEVVLTASYYDVCEAALQKITDEDVLKKVALKDSDSYVRLVALQKINDVRFLKEFALEDSDSDVHEAAKRIIEKVLEIKRLLLWEHVQIFLSPVEEYVLGHTNMKEYLLGHTHASRHYLSVAFSNQQKTGSNQWEKTSVAFGKGHTKHEVYEATQSGWSLAALGKLIAQDCTPERFKASLEQFETDVMPLYNRQVNEYEKQRKELLQLYDKVKRDKRQDVLSDFPAKQKAFEREALKIERFVLAESDRAGVLPFAFFMQVINDSQGRFDRFIRQGAIMGMIDFFMKYRDHEIIKPYFENLLAARRDMISSDSQMSFFEVRAPMNCTAKEYAVILKEVLHCANPTLRYCDTEKLMAIAEREIPGIMDLLVHYPLRLIDPGNETTEGFYTFEPYRHAMWERYTPPKNVGQVHKRYHEVLDMTLPNSSGLNVRLFADPYAAVPVMFHEYNHYMEDPNEASVFLKTYAFSLTFYRKYPDANPGRDATFIYLNHLFGNTPDVEDADALNALILKYYGAPKSKEAAVAEADADLRMKNMSIAIDNDAEKWCPEVKMPLLNNDGDKENADLIREIRIRHAQAPRTVTPQTFERLWQKYMPVSRSPYEEYRKLVPGMFLELKETEVDGKTVKCFADWKSFKDWCIEAGYIKRYTS